MYQIGHVGGKKKRTKEVRAKYVLCNVHKVYTNINENNIDTECCFNLKVSILKPVISDPTYKQEMRKTQK